MIRAKDLDEEIEIAVTIEDQSKTYVKIIKVKFQCPSCGTIISVLQLEEKLELPSKCSCGRKRDFKIVSRDFGDFIDAVIKDVRTGLSYECVFNGKFFEKLKIFEEQAKKGKNVMLLKGKVCFRYKDKSNIGEYFLEATDIKNIKEGEKGI